MSDTNDNTKNSPAQQPPAQTPPQPAPLYETVPEDQAVGSPGLQPEEAPDSAASPEQAYIEEKPQAVSNDNSPPPIYEESKTKYFIIGGGVLFFLFIFFIFFSLFLGGKKSAKPVNLTYWMLWEDATVFDPLVKQYEKAHPNVKINVQKMSPEDYREKLSARIPTGQGPDIFRYHNTWLPMIKDLVAPLPKSIMSDQTFTKTFYPVQAQDLKMGTSFYGIPLEIDGLVLIYNADLFEKANISQPPANLDELIDQNFLGKFTFKDTDGQLRSSAIAMGTTSNVEHFSDIFGLLLLQNGGDLKNLDDPSAAGALEGYRKFAEVGVWDDTMPNSITAFAQEKVAMIIAPSWEILNIKAINPDIKLKVSTIPFNLPGNKPISLSSYWVEGVSKKSPNSLEAWKFLEFLSEKDNMTKLYAEEKKTRLFGEPYSRIDLADKLVTDENIGVVISQADQYKSLPLISRTNDKGLNDSIITYIQNAINSAAQGVSYSEALIPAKKGVDQIYSQYKMP
jgi:multiple sugar transport system substrate-binding protein